MSASEHGTVHIQKIFFPSNSVTHKMHKGLGAAPAIDKNIEKNTGAKVPDFSPDSLSYRGSYFQYEGGLVYKFEHWTWCRCWGYGGVGVHVRGLDVVALLGAIAGNRGGWVVNLLGAIAGDSGGLGGLDVVAVAGCHCWVPLLRIGEGWVLADWTWCRCWVPLLGCYWWG